MDRRTFLTRTAVVGATAWVAPTILTVDRANATMRHSAPPSPPPTHDAPPVGRVDGDLEMGPPLPAKLPGSLPFTGDNQRDELAVGIASVAVGAVVVAIARESNADRRSFT